MAAVLETPAAALAGTLLAERMEEAYLDALTAAVFGQLRRLQRLVVSRLRGEPTALVAAVSWQGDRSPISAQDWVDLLGGPDVVDVLGDVVVDAATQAAMVIGTNVGDQTVAAVLREHMANMRSWGPAIANSVREHVDRLARDASNLDEVASGLAGEGWFSEAQARNIAKAELAAAANGGMHAGWVAAGVLTKRWRTVRDARVRDAHRAVEGQVRPLGQPFDVGGYSAMYPGAVNLPIHLRVNCLPADTPVGHGIVTAGLRRRYDGPLVRLRLLSGVELAGTPNHPVLTENGWVALGDLAPGQHLVCACRGEHGSARGEPDVQRPPSTIGEVVATLDGTGAVERVGAMAVDLHGERPERDVEVVRADGSLWLSGPVLGAKPAEELGLALTDVAQQALLRQSLVGADLGALWASPGFVRGSSEPAPLIRVGAGHASGQGGAPSPDWGASFDQATADDGPSDARILGQRLLGLAVEVALDEVVDVEVEAFHGDVFTLETTSGWYTAAGGAVVRNCRCTMVRGEATAPDDLGGLTKDELLKLAKELGIRGRHRMDKARLREEIDRWRTGMAGIRLDRLTRNQLLERAKQAGIVNRHRMGKGELVDRLRGRNPTGPDGRTRSEAEEDRWRTDNGYVTRRELGDAHKRARTAATTAERLGGQATGEPRGPGDPAERERGRREVFEKWRLHEDADHAPCVFCGAKLSWTTDRGENPQGHEVLARVRLDRRRGFEVDNVVPACRHDADEALRRARVLAEEERAGPEPGHKPSTAYKQLSARDVRAAAADQPGVSDEARSLIERFSEGVKDERRRASLRAERIAGHIADLPSAPPNVDPRFEPFREERRRIEADDPWDKMVASARRGRRSRDVRTLDEAVRTHFVPADVVGRRVLVTRPGEDLYRLLEEKGLGRSTLSTPEHAVVKLGRTGDPLEGLDLSRGGVAVHFEVRVPRGTQGLVVDHALGRTVDGTVILPRDQKMRVVGTPWFDHDGYHVTVEAVPTAFAGAAPEVPVVFPKGRDPRFLVWGTRGTELAGAVEGRRRLGALTEESAPAAYNARFGPYETQVRSASMQREKGGRTVEVTMDVRDASGFRIGEARVSTRTETFGDEDELTSAHVDEVTIDPSRRGEGVFTALLRDLENYWAANGVDRVTTTARNAGGFAMARRGFDFDATAVGSEKVGSYLAGRLTNAVPKPLRPYLADPDALATREGKAALKRERWTPGQFRDVVRMQRRLREAQIGDPEFPTPLEVAMTGYRTGLREWAGKRGMTGATWPGVKYLVGPEAVVASASSSYWNRGEFHGDPKDPDYPHRGVNDPPVPGGTIASGGVKVVVPDDPDGIEAELTPSFDDLLERALAQSRQARETKQTEQAVDRYTAGLSDAINRLRRGTDDSELAVVAMGQGLDVDRMKRDAQITAETLDRSMRPADEGLVVFRGVPADVADRMKVGQLFVDQGFLSTSTSKDSAQGYGDRLLEVRLPKGAMHLPLNEYVGTDEVLLPSALEVLVLERTDDRIVLGVGGVAPVASPVSTVTGPDYGALMEQAKAKAKDRDAKWSKAMSTFKYSSAAKDGSYVSLYMKSGSRFDIEPMSDGSYRARWTPRKPAPTDEEREQVDVWLNGKDGPIKAVPDLSGHPDDGVDLRHPKPADEAKMELALSGAVGPYRTTARVQVDGGLLEGIHIWGDVETADGTHVGEYARTVTAEDGEVVVKNSSLDIEPEYQGHGAASDLIALQDAYWRAHGVDEVQVTAAKVGAYAWADEYGWARPGPEASADKVEEYFDRSRTEAGEMLDAIAKNGGDIEAFRKRVDDAKTTGDLPTPFEISQIGRTPGAKTWPGRDGLLAFGAEGGAWTGERRLNDPPGRPVEGVLDEDEASRLRDLVGRLRHVPKTQTEMDEVNEAEFALARDAAARSGVRLRPVVDPPRPAVPLDRVEVDGKRFPAEPAMFNHVLRQSQAASANKVRDRWVGDDDGTLALNAALRAGTTTSTQDRRARELDRLIAAGELRERGSLYRGAWLDPEVVGRFEPGTRLESPGFMSTSPEERVSRSYLSSRASENLGRVGVLFVVETPTSTPVGVMDANEFVLARGQALVIDGIDEVDSQGRVVVRATLEPGASSVVAAGGTESAVDDGGSSGERQFPGSFDDPFFVLPPADQPVFERVIPVWEFAEPDPIVAAASRFTNREVRSTALARVSEVHDAWEAQHLAVADFAPEDSVWPDYRLHYLDIDGTGVQHADFASRLRAAALL